MIRLDILKQLTNLTYALERMIRLDVLPTSSLFTYSLETEEEDRIG